MFGTSAANAGSVTFPGNAGAGVFYGSNGPQAPYINGSEKDPDNYFAAGPGANVVFTFDTAQEYFGLDWGSADSTNALTFYNGTSVVYTLSASQMAAAGGGSANTNLGPGGSWYVNVVIPTGYTSVVASSTYYNMEFGNVSYSTSSPQSGSATILDTTAIGPLTVMAPANASLSAGAAATVAGISLAESGSAVGETFTVMLSDTNGLLSATGSGVTGSGTDALTVTGSLTQVNADLASLEDLEAGSGTDTISVAATDSLGNAAPVTAIAVTANGPLAITAPATSGVGAGQAGAINGVSLSDTDAVNGETFTIHLTAAGMLSATGTGVSGAGTDALTLTGALAQVNADLATLTDTDATAGSDTIGLTASDSQGDSAQSASIAVTVNGPLSLAVPGADFSLVIGQAVAISGINLAESGDTIGEIFTIKLSDVTGLLSATGASVSGEGTTGLTITGSLAQVNTDLATLTDTEDAAGSDSISLSASDGLGGNATGGIAVTADLLGVTPVSGTPPAYAVNTLDLGNAGSTEYVTGKTLSFGTTATNAGTVTFSGNIGSAGDAGVYEGDGYTRAPYFSTSDKDSANYFAAGPAAVTITFDATQAYFGILWGSADSGNTLTFYNGTTVVYTLTAAEMAAAGGGAADGNTGPGGSFYVNLVIPGGYSSVVASSDVPFEFTNVSYSTNAPQTGKAKTIVAAPNGPLSLTVPGSELIPIGAISAISGVSLAETGDTAGEIFTVTVSDANGTLSASGAGITGAHSKTLTLSGSLAQVNGDLARLVDLDKASGPDTITLGVTDSLGDNASSSIAITTEQVIKAGQVYTVSGPASDANLVVYGGLNVKSGGTVSNAQLYSGGDEKISAAADTNATLYAGGLQYIYAGGTATDAVVSGGAQFISGGNAAGTEILAGGGQVLRGGVASASVISSGGRQSVSAGITEATIIQAGGSQTVVLTGIASASVVSNGGTQVLRDGGEGSGSVISSGGAQRVYDGGASLGAVIYGGGSQTIAGGGIAENSVISGGTQLIYGGTAYGTVLDAGTEYVYKGGIADGSVISGGEQLLYDHGTATGTVIYAGGSQTISKGGLADGSVIFGGAQTIDDLGTASGTVIHVGGSQTISGGGISDATVISGGGSQIVAAGGVASATHVVSGGTLDIAKHGYAKFSVISKGGVESVAAGGIDQNSVISSGGMTFIAKAGIISGTNILSGGSLTISAGGLVENGLIISGGSAIISGSTTLGESVTFAGSGGFLGLDNTAGFGAAIAGFATGDVIDLGKFAYAGAAASFTEAANNTSGTLLVDNGGVSMQFMLIGNYVGNNFALSSDLSSGTFVKLA